MNVPRIATALDARDKTSDFDVLAVRDILAHLLPKDFFSQSDVEGRLLERLPLITYLPLNPPPCDITFFLCSRFRENTFRFFCEMIRKWIIPKKQSNILLQFAVDFQLPDITEEWFIAAKMSLRCHSQHEKELIVHNLPSLLVDLRLGVESAHHASRILEVRGISYDEKTRLIQERIASVIKKRPHDFDYDLMTQMQRFFVLCKEEFKQPRSVRHITRILCTHYLFRKALRLSVDAFPDRRYISVKVLRAELKGGHKVLGLILGLSFLRENEFCEARHILGAIKTLIPTAQKVEGSYYVYSEPSDPTYMMYLEIEKPGEFFSDEEMFMLKQELPSALKGRIEQRVHSLFMPQNEEEIMRRIVTLSGELKYVRDLPQVMIDFTGQTHDKLTFLIVVLRVTRPKQLSILQEFSSHPTSLEFVFDRREEVGELRQKYKKEATLFHLYQNKHPFLRQDHSIDLYKARQHVVRELTRVLGEFRDYNGGTLCKEREVFEVVRQLLGDLAEENHFLLENFFFSLQPVVMRSLVAPEVLARLFEMLIEAQIEGLVGEPYQIRIKEDGAHFYFLALAEDPSFAEAILEYAETFEQLYAVTSLLPALETPCFGLVCRHHDPEEARALWYRLEKTLCTWADRRYSSGVLIK